MRVELRTARRARGIAIGVKRRMEAFARWLADHEAVPTPMGDSRWRRVALASVALAALAQVVVVIAYLFTLHDAFGTPAEDLGIMDQVLWNTVHGHFMQQTICNSVTDTNCLGDVSRFAIHFEPILMPLALLYVIAPSIKVLLVVQAVVVASGAFGAYLLAERRLRHTGWGVLFALLYLFHPALLAAATDGFYPETLTTAMLMWAMYFLVTRRYAAVVGLCALALLCKETLALDVMAIGLFITFVQHRSRLGVALAGLGALTLALALALMHLASPLGRSPVSDRLDGVLHAPLATLALIASDPARHTYLVALLAPLVFLPLLSPWMLALALPAILLNLVSSDPQMYSGGHQYNADIVPLLLAAAVDALVWLLPLARRAALEARAELARVGTIPRRVNPRIGRAVVAAAMLSVLVAILPAYAARSTRAVTRGQSWPAITQHDVVGRQIMTQIPSGASVSAQSMLVPHLSERPLVYQFPSGVEHADYILLDAASGSFYPFASPADYLSATRTLLASCAFDLLAARDGYLLLRRTGAFPGFTRADNACPRALPPTFYSFIYAAPPPGATRTAIVFDNEIELVGYTLNPPTVHLDQPELTITTYWRALRPLPAPLTLVVTVRHPDGVSISLEDAPAQMWRPAQGWETGAVVKLQSWPIYFDADEKGTVRIGAEVRAGNPADAPGADAVLSVTALAAIAGLPPQTPRTINGNTDATLALLRVQ